ncbi:MAG TPA: DUF2167 domain-containing protein [Allosphingosinicella sp.]|nr:DUF2167 domain-containing protein [Allosphingosinicella sp.]
MRRLSFLVLGALAFFWPATLALGSASTNSAQSTETAAEQEARQLRVQQQLHPVTGDVQIPGANAVLHLGQDYYFLPASEARLVLTEAWGNPPEEADGVLGMVFPAGASLMDDTWGAVITYEAEGHVSDSDAAAIDEDAVLDALRGDEAATNTERAAEGLPAKTLVGWAQRPVYDPRTHSVVWARNIRYADWEENALNYSVRLLGRRGVLSLDIIGYMSQLAETREQARRLAAAAEFVPGERYADFRPRADRAAGYGIAGLIAASVGATMPTEIEPSWLLLPLLVIFAIVGLALFWTRIRGLLSGRGDAPVAAYAETPRPPSGAR